MKILWIAGWASNFELWKNEILEKFDAKSSFATPHQIPLVDEDFDLIICWSLGIHHLPDHLKSSKVLMINPALDFCNNQGGVHPKILNRMIKQILSSPEEVLKTFAINCGYSDTEASAWIQEALEISIDNLVEGLEQLKQVCQLDSKHQYALLQSSDDKIVSPSVNKTFTERSDFNMAHKEILGSHKVNLSEVKIYLRELNWI